MNKLEICLTELKEKTNCMEAIGVKVVVNLSCSRNMCVEYFKVALNALEQTDKNVFMDALEEYRKEKQGE